MEANKRGKKCSTQDYVCIECGKPARDLYREVTSDVLKISHCAECGKVVDKYIEFDNTIICLDLLLHKFQAYRHLIFNNNMISFGKLQLILLLCDTFMKWDSKSATLQDNYSRVFYAALEVEFYRMFALSILQWANFVLFIHLMLEIRRKIFSSGFILKIKMDLLVKGLTLSSFARLLTIPAIVFGQTHSLLCLSLIKLLLITSTTAMLGVVCSTNHSTALILAAVGTVIIPVVSDKAYIQLEDTLPLLF